MEPSVGVVVRKIVAATISDSNLVSTEVIILVQDVRARTSRSSCNEGIEDRAGRKESHDGFDWSVVSLLIGYVL